MAVRDHSMKLGQPRWAALEHRHGSPAHRGLHAHLIPDALGHALFAVRADPYEVEIGQARHVFILRVLPQGESPEVFI